MNVRAEETYAGAYGSTHERFRTERVVAREINGREHLIPVVSADNFLAMVAHGMTHPTATYLTSTGDILVHGAVGFWGRP